VAEDGAVAGVRAEKTAKHAEESGLTASVRSEEAIDLAAAHLEIDVVDDHAVTEALGHAADINDVVAIVVQNRG
jgi:hypothetical protein